MSPWCPCSWAPASTPAKTCPVLVQQLRDNHPQVAIHVQPAIGEDPRMTALMADIACERPAA
jgi:sirohydrochlorin ferrochelatase